MGVVVVRARLRTSIDATKVHAFESDGGIAFRSECGGITTMPYLLDATDDPLTCLGCGADWSKLVCLDEAARLNERSGPDAQRFYRAVPDDYVLKVWEP